MPARPEPKGARKCCCCIPIRGGVMILAWLYFLGGVAAAALAFTLLARALVEITVTIKALLLVLAILSISLSVASAIGIFATIRLHARAARLYYILFCAWFLLQLALDIAVVVMFFTKSLDSLIPECKSLGGRRGGIGRVKAQKDCETARNRMSWYYTVSMVVRSAVGYYFVRRIASFSRHCAERATARSNPPPTSMAPASTFAPSAQSLQSAPPSSQQDVPIGGTMFASNFPARPTRVAHAKPSTTIGQSAISARSPSTLEAYPRSYQASAESIQAENPVKEAPPCYSHGATHNV